MPATRSAKKRLKTDKKKRAKNLRVKKSLKALIKDLNQTVEIKKEGEAKEALLKAGSALDRAASKGIIHKNTAGRKKSRLAKKVNQLTVTQVSPSGIPLTPPSPPRGEVSKGDLPQAELR